jgi:hypothetical protein
MIVDPAGPQPTLPQKMLIFQLQAVYEDGNFQAEKRRYLRNDQIDRLDEAAFLAAQSPPAMLTSFGVDPEDPNCSICLLQFGEPSEGGVEFPVKPPCGHIFGEKCLGTWPNETENCPYRRHTFTINPARKRNQLTRAQSLQLSLEQDRIYEQYEASINYHQHTGL